MTITQWFLFFIAVQLIHFLGTWKLYKKAGRQAWEAAVPIYNGIVLMKIINRPWWYVILLFIPIVNLIMFPVVWVETLRSFGKNKTTDTILGILTLGLYIYYVNYTQDVIHIKDRSLKPKSKSGDWTSAILFAVVVATIVHTYFIQPFTIPTSSLEKTLLVGDFLFVSKNHYGARTPMTAVSFPMVHDTIPVVKKKSYWNSPQIPYFRFPAFQKIKNNDIVVFNWPTDTVPYFGYKGPNSYLKPIDKKSNYVKRAIGIPGDILEIKNGDAFINNTVLPIHDRQKLQFYHIITIAEGTRVENIRKDYNIRESYSGGLFNILSEYWDNAEVKKYLSDIKNAADLNEQHRDSLSVTFSGYLSQDAINRLNIKKLQNIAILNITKEIAEQMKSDSRIVKIEQYTTTSNSDVFPHNKNWSVDNYGPISIPKKDEKVAISIDNISLYKRIIETYEGSELGIENKITLAGNQVLLNEKPITEYTFLQDYYWMMGDNRHNSADSRSFGFVPHNHIVGKPVFIWLSLDANKSGLSKVRWERMFTTVGGSGEPVSYFRYFLIVLAGWFIFDFLRKRKKKTEDV